MLLVITHIAVAAFIFAAMTGYVVRVSNTGAWIAFTMAILCLVGCLALSYGYGYDTAKNELMCKNCGESMKTEWVVCPYCGEKVQDG